MERTIWDLVRSRGDTPSASALAAAIHLASNRVIGGRPWAGWTEGRQMRAYLRDLADDAVRAGPQLLHLHPVARQVADGLATTWEQHISELITASQLLAASTHLAVGSRQATADSPSNPGLERLLPASLHSGNIQPRENRIAKNAFLIAAVAGGPEIVGRGDLSLPDLRAIAAFQDGRSAVVVLPEGNPSPDTLPHLARDALWVAMDGAAYVLDHHRPPMRNGYSMVRVGWRWTRTGRCISTGKANVQAISAERLHERLQRIVHDSSSRP